MTDPANATFDALAPTLLAGIEAAAPGISGAHLVMSRAVGICRHEGFDLPEVLRAVGDAWEYAEPVAEVEVPDDLNDYAEIEAEPDAGDLVDVFAARHADRDDV